MEKGTSKYWKQLIGKRVRLMVKDKPFPQPRDGVLIDIDSTHIFLKIDNVEEPKPFNRNSIKRVDVIK